MAVRTTSSISHKKAHLNSIVLDQRLSSPLYVQLRDALGNAIEHHFKEGDDFYSDPELVRHLGISRFTVRQAIDELVRAGCLVRQRGKGTLVKQPEHIQTTLGHVGAFIGSYESDYATSMLEALSKECASRGLLLHVYYTDNGVRMSDAYGRVVRLPEEEGLLFLASGFELYGQFTELGYRTVALEAGILDYPGPSVETDSTLAVQIGMQHLMDLGHRNITLLVTEIATSLSVREKIDAFLEIAGRHSLSVEVVDCGVPERGSPRDCAYREMDSLWSRGSRPTAVFTVSDYGAIGVLKWCTDNNIAVPTNMSVLGFEGSRAGDFVSPALTSVSHPVEALARALVDMLVDNSRRQLRLTPSLLIRDSTGHAAEKF